MSVPKKGILMKRVLWGAMVSLLLGFFLLSCVSKQKYQALKADYQEVKDENRALSEEKRGLSSRKKSLQATTGGQKERIENIKVGIRFVQDSIDSIQDLAYDMEALKRKYRRTRTKLAQVRSINELLYGNLTALREDLGAIGGVALDSCYSREGSDRIRCFMYAIEDWEYRP